MVRPDPLNWEEAERAIRRIADVAEGFAGSAGVGGTETAGFLVSYLARHPRDIKPVLQHGVFELPEDWGRRGRLTYMTPDGKLWHPDAARRAATIRNLERGA